MAHLAQCAIFLLGSKHISAPTETLSLRNRAAARVLQPRYEPLKQVSNENAKETLIITVLLGSLGSLFFLIVFRKGKKNGAAVDSSFSGASVNLRLCKAAKSSTPHEEAIPPRSWEPCFPPSGPVPNTVQGRTSLGGWQLTAYGKEKDQVVLNENPGVVVSPGILLKLIA